MKTINLDAPGDRSLGIVRGHVGPNRAGTPGQTLVDANGNSSTQPEVHFTGATVINGDGYTQVIISSGLGWFDVTSPLYGAQGDGTTDDTTSIDLAIAALNAAGSGVLYFPAGAYLCTAALTAITATGYLLGDGFVGSLDGTTTFASKIICSSGSANFLTIGSGFSVEKIALANTAGSVTAGYGIGMTSAIFPRFTDVSVQGFWINFDIDGSGWKATRCYARQSHKYGYRIRYVAVPDGGDWNMTDCEAVDGANSSDAAIYYASGGGGKISGLKINSSSSGFNHGIDMHIPNGVATGDLSILGGSIEGFRGDGIHMQTDAGGTFANVQLTGVQIGQDGSYNTTGNAVSVTANTAGDLSNIHIVGLMVRPFGGNSSGYVVKLSKADRVTLLPISYSTATNTYAGVLSQSGCTNIYDYTIPGGSSAFHGCRATANANTTMTTANTEYPIAFAGTDTYDTDAYHDPSTNNTRCTVPTGLDGYYIARGGAYVGVVGSKYLDLKIRLNGSGGTVLGQFRWSAADSNPIGIVLTDPYALVATDYVELYAESDSAAVFAASAQSFLSLYRVGT